MASPPLLNIPSALHPSLFCVIWTYAYGIDRNHPDFICLTETRIKTLYHFYSTFSQYPSKLHVSSATNYKLIHSCNKKQELLRLLQYRLRLSDNGPNMQNSRLRIHIIIPRDQMRVMGRRCCGKGSSEGGGGPNDFLAGGPEFEVTPLGKSM